MALTLMYITNNLEVALIAERCGVDRIWIDLEVLGKEERQKGMDTVKSRHSICDIKKIAPALTSSELLVRINPWNINSMSEIDEVVNAGADAIMLPMWKCVEEVKGFINHVGEKCKKILLLETKEAVNCLEEILLLSGIDEIHIGLNDLHLSYGMTFMFELLANGMVDEICAKIKKFGIPYGFGGIARLGAGDLPAEKILMEHYRLGSTRAILSRSFCDTEFVQNKEELSELFFTNMKSIRNYEEKIKGMTMTQFEKNRKSVVICVNQIVQAKGRKKNDSKF